MKIQVVGPMFLENIAFFFVAHGGDPAACRLSVRFDATEAVVASVHRTSPRTSPRRPRTTRTDHDFKALRRQGISTALHDVAFEWATGKDLRFFSGVITSDENQAYWEKLETAKQAQRTDTKILNAVREAYFAGLKKIPRHLSPEVLCSKHNDDTIAESERQEILALSGIEFDVDYNQPETFAEYVVWVINHGDPGIEAVLEPTADSLTFGGSDRLGRHIGCLGYGLFSI